MKHWLPTLLTALLSALPNLIASAQESPVQTTQETLRQWIEVEKDIASERSEWMVEKMILQDSVAVLEAEKETLLERIEQAESAATQADRERSFLADENDQLKALADSIESTVASQETQVLAILPSLPEPLLKEIAPLTSRLRATSSGQDERTFSQRLQVLVSILGQIDKFNSDITAVSEIRELDNGRNVEVTTLYIGLAAAYFVDAAGQYAGFGYPTDSGWQFEVDHSLAPKVLQAVTIQERSQSAAFLGLPASIR